MATERKAQVIPEVSTVQEVSNRPLVQSSEAPPLTSASSNTNGIFLSAAASCLYGAARAVNNILR
jgi:hypothetical protein